MASDIICATEPLEHKGTVLENRVGITNIAKTMWETWKDCVYPDNVGIGWQGLLGIVSLNWFRFTMWASGDLPWEDQERQLARECKSKFQGCQFPPGVLTD